jgi:signal transduction histidine kinase
VRLDTALWRAIAVYRVAALLYATGSMVAYTDTYANPALGWAVLAAMAVWTAVAAYLYADPRRRGWPLLVVDLALVMSAVLSSVLVQTPERIALGDPTVPVSWAAAPAVAWGVHWGWRGGAVAAAGVSTAAVIARGDPSQATVNSVVLLLLLGTVVGYVVSLARRAERTYAQAVQLQAATAERERLSRSVHDGVLQAARAGLPSDHRPGAGRAGSRAGGGAAPAGQQRRSVAGGRGRGGPVRRTCDRCCRAARTCTWRPRRPGAAARTGGPGAGRGHRRRGRQRPRHGGGEAWLLVEDEPEAVTVTVRDAGPGIAPGRLEQAARDGRLGVAQSIRGRVADLGGRVDVISDGHGTEVELHVPRPR